MDNLINMISQLGLSQLEKLAGPTILKAVKDAYDVNINKELANLIFDRYSNKILEKKEIRFGFIDGMDFDKAQDFCNQKGFDINDSNSKIEPLQKLTKYFSSSNESKIKEFIELFKLPVELIPKKEEDFREEKIRIKAVFNERLLSKGTLHPYQIKVKDSLSKKVLHDQTPRTMVEMPTGAGKTMTALEFVVDFIRSHKFSGKIVWVVNSNELADQAFNSFENLWKLRGDRPTNAYRFFGKFKPNFLDNEDGIVFTSFTTCDAAITSKHSEVIQNFKQLCDDTKLVIVDEAHSSTAQTYQNTIYRLQIKKAILIGISATPKNNDIDKHQALKGIYGSNIIKIQDDDGIDLIDAIKYLQDEDFLAQISYEPLNSGFDLKDVDEKQACIELGQNSKRNKMIVNQIESAVRNNHSTIVFACSVDHVIALTALCRKQEIDVDFITGEVSSSKRNEIMDRFKKDELKVIINYDLLATGIDLPSVNKLIITRPIGSPILYSQIIGRALRGPKNGGNETNIIVNIKDNLINYRNENLLYNELTF